MDGISAISGSATTMSIAPKRGNAATEETREPQVEKTKELRQGEEANKPASPPPSADVGNTFNLLA